MILAYIQEYLLIHSWLVGLLASSLKSERNKYYIEEDHVTQQPSFIQQLNIVCMLAQERAIWPRYVSIGGRRRSFSSVGKWRALLVCVSSHHSTLRWVELQRGGFYISFTTSLG